jgi:hypothetical protein
VRRYVDAHPTLRRPFYQVPHRHGMTGTAAQFLLHVSDLMDGRARLGKVPGPAPRNRSMVTVPSAAA